MWEDMGTFDLDDTIIDILVQREGSSQRTVEELINRFLDDVTALASEDEHLDCCGSIARLDEIRDRADTGDLEHLEWLADQAENLLADLLYLVEWDDGYIIYREA